ncbi:MAG TPA: phosphoribosylformylglycinamidine synthase [Candidatus Fimisoma avicola]|uniref:Phosphoribosylformylglycinamidine synthase n=1 Tax=Candidatus Fimisoma avicola TaxID=2840826 RepID=A0A9D1I557_9FIRM|nr:phosphoribosylformylglycinamidine synthase [Candidatus Fimisoma avicola]
MVFRIYVEKKPGFDNEARALKSDINELLRISSIERVRIFNRYDVEGITEELFDYAVNTVFSEPQVDVASAKLPSDVTCDGAGAAGACGTGGGAGCLFAVEPLPGQFDQRASSAAECIQIISRGERPAVKTAKVYALYGNISDDEAAAVKKYVINAVESREASMDMPETLDMAYEIPAPVEILAGFRKMSDDDLEQFIKDRGLAMDLADIKTCRDYFTKEDRDPTITEIKMIDTYWSDHCRHTTFNTVIDSVEFDDPMLAESYERYIRLRKELGRTKPVTLMDIGTIAAKYLKKAGKLDKLDESEEINACTVKIKVNVDGREEDWLLLFKNETHNHPTEIEPFGGAATCVGGAIRDPLSGRCYVYSAMRVTGAGDPLVPVSETIEGKLPQRKLVTTAAAGYSSYGNQIGLATGQVDEIYHPGYIAKRMEIGAVIGAAPAENVIRKVPEPGDRVILLGGRTGRDGCGGATGSSKSHDVSSLESCGAEVQKGNAPEERKLQRLFRNPQASRLIKRCNDFGAGGVSVAIGELADGLVIDLNKVPKKYEGLDGTELAISESQERMAVVVAEKDADRFCILAREENLEATVVAKVTEEPRLSMFWNGDNIVNISREFLSSNGASKHVTVKAAAPKGYDRKTEGTFTDAYKAACADLNICSKRGLSERFDSTIGAGTVLMPFGGKYQRTPIQAMVNKVSVERGDTDTCSLMAWGYNPYITEKSPYHGAYLAVVESVSKLIATGASFEDVYLSFQEYFEKLGKDPEKWGSPMAALLGALDAQMGLEVAAIGGKDSMSGTFEDIHVPPTLVSFAVTTAKTGDIISPEFKGAGHDVYLFRPEKGENGLPTGASLKAVYARVNELMASGCVKACYTPGFGGIAEAILKMAMGNGIGFEYDKALTQDEIFGYDYGAFIVEVCGSDAGTACGEEGILIGRTTDDGFISRGGEKLVLEDLCSIYEEKLEPVYPCNIRTEEEAPEAISFASSKTFSASVKTARPKTLIPVFPGTNCEYDTAKAFDRAGAEPEIFVINNLTASDVASSIESFAAKVRESQMIFIPGGFSGGDEPDGSGKLITAFFRNQEIKEAVTELLEERDGLMAGICNGFQALIKLGLVPFGKIMDTDADCPTLTYNKIARHQSKLVRVRIASNNSPWLAGVEVGDIYTVPISHGEGRFIASEPLLKDMAAKGQIITQYVDLAGKVTNDIQFNPNGSDWAVEGIVSPDGRVLGKMGHAERIGAGLYRNVPGQYDMKMFESAVKYFK